MKIDIPKNNYITKLEINDKDIEVAFAEKKKIALLLIGINKNYWPYLKQVIEDCRVHFLPHHNVDFFVWTDIPEKGTKEYRDILEPLLTQEVLNKALTIAQNRPNNQFFSREVIQGAMDFILASKDITVVPQDPIEWPHPTLMRYHLFLNKEEELKNYDYIFYLDSDMRVVQKISDEILGDALTVAEHPMYSLRKEYIPPYEPNKESKAYIPRLGQIITQDGVPRFRPLYLAGGFQGGKSAHFIDAMKAMKKQIDYDFDKNYIAIWNDESHWNKYVFEHANPVDGHPTVVLGPEYVHPDSLIKEYYEPVWGRTLTPKIVTLTKPFTLSKQGGNDLRKFMGQPELPNTAMSCPTCGNTLESPGHKILKVLECHGSGNAHQVEMTKIV